MNVQEDKDLIRLLINDNEMAFVELYSRYKNPLVNYCARSLTKEESSDLTQEIMIYVWESRHYLDPELNFASYIYKIAHNRVLNHLRDNKKHKEIDKRLLVKQPRYIDTLENDLIDKEYQILLQKAINMLPERRREVFDLSRKEGKQHKEIAAILNISVSTVQEHISESLKFIKKNFNSLIHI